MTTNNAVNTPLAGTTGTGNFVGSNSPTLVTPALGTPASGVTTNLTGDKLGTTTNDNAAAGHVGEYISSVIPVASPVTMASNAATDVTSISLTAGDWDITANVSYIGMGTTAIGAYVWTSTTSATVVDQSLYTDIGLGAAAVLTTIGLNAPSVRYSLSTPTTIYLTSYLANTSGTGSACGAIYARRAR